LENGKMKKKKVLCLFDYFARTGFGTVSKNIVKEIKKNFYGNLQLDIIAINYFGEPYEEDENTFIISGRMNDVKDDFYGRHVFLKCLMEGDYDGVFICQDLGVVVPIIEIIDFIKSEKKHQNRKVFKSIFYFPVDCNIVYELTKNLEMIDVLVTYTEYGKKQILKHKPNLKIKIVPHGNNSKDFYPLSESEIKKFRKEFFGYDNKFIVTNLNRNQPRKDLPQTIFGFIEAKNQWKTSYSAFLPEPFLYLHCHPNDPYGWDLRAVLMQTDLVEDEDYKLLPKEFEEMMADTEIVNKIYNASDVYLTTTLGEGWGLGYSEAASCRVPIIAPYSTSFMEMSGYGRNAYMLTTLVPFCSTFDNVLREQTDSYEIADKIIAVAMDKYSNSEVIKKKVQNSYEWVKKLEWSEVCKSWVNYFKETF
jgi:glycosyltransferase involved in cell wall biosynthesis